MRGGGVPRGATCVRGGGGVRRGVGGGGGGGGVSPAGVEEGGEGGAGARGGAGEGGAAEAEERPDGVGAGEEGLRLRRAGKGTGNRAADDAVGRWGGWRVRRAAPVQSESVGRKGVRSNGLVYVGEAAGSESGLKGAGQIGRESARVELGYDEETAVSSEIEARRLRQQQLPEEFRACRLAFPIIRPLHVQYSPRFVLKGVP